MYIEILFNNSNTFILKEIMVRKIILDLFVITVKVIVLFYSYTFLSWNNQFKYAKILWCTVRKKSIVTIEAGKKLRSKGSIPRKYSDKLAWGFSICDGFKKVHNTFHTPLSKY